LFSPVRHGWWALNVTLTFIVGIAIHPTPALAQSKDESRAALSLLTSTGLPPESVALSIRSPDGQVVLEHQATRPFNPASTVKVVTTRAALGLLGEDFRFKTRLYARGQLKRGRFDGVLALKGGGDPKLLIEDIDEIVSRLRALGYQTLTGEWRLDGSLFSEPEVSPAEFDGQPFKPYNVTPHAGMLNFKAVRVTVWQSGGRLKAEADPALFGLKISPKVRLISGNCAQNQMSLGWKGPETLVLEGQIGRACPGMELYVSVFDHLQFSYRLFAQAWQRAGGSIRMRPQLGAVPANAPLVLEWVSPRPLLELVADINKRSNNPMARSVFLGLSAQTGGAGNREDATRRVSQWLAGRGLQFPELVLENGSGLSRHERISARNMTALLLDGLRDPEPSRWIETLPAAGQDGTLRRRLKDPSVQGRAWVKTGTLDDVRAYAGYVQANSGRLIAFSAFINHPQARLAREPLDRLVEWMIENL